MQVKVLLFGFLAAKAGWKEKSVGLSDGATVGDLLTTLAGEDAAIRDASAKLAFAVNHEYQKQTHPLHDGDEVALIPPVSGG